MEDDDGGSSSSVPHLRRTRSSRTRTPRGAGITPAASGALFLVGGGHNHRQQSQAMSSQSSSSLSLPKWARIVNRKPETARNDGWMWEHHKPSTGACAPPTMSGAGAAAPRRRHQDGALSASESRATTPRSSRRHSRAQQEEPDRRRRPREDHRHGDDRNRRRVLSSSSTVLHDVLVEEDSILRTFWFHQLSRELDVRVQQLVGRHLLEDVVHSRAAHSFFFGCKGFTKEGSASTTATATSARTTTTRDLLADGVGDANEEDPDDFVTYFSLVEEAAAIGGGVGTSTKSEGAAAAEASPRKRPRLHHNSSGEITDQSARADAVSTLPLHHHLLQRQLPILVVTPGPYDGLDRHTLWVPQLVHHVRRSCPRTCCVWIDLGACDHDTSNPYGADLANRHGGNSGNINNGYLEGSTTTTANNHRPWKKELLRQCVLQEPRQRSGTNSPLDGHGWTERMVDWARHSTRFDDICVVLEASGAERNNATVRGGSAQSMRLEALRWMGHVRDHYGVPFKVVIMGPAVGVSDFSLQASTGPGAAGWSVSTVHLRSPYSNRPSKESASSIQPIITPASSALYCHLLHLHQQTPQQQPSHSGLSAFLSRIQSLLQLPPLHRNENPRDNVDPIRDVHSSSMARSVMDYKKGLAQSLVQPASFFVPMLMWALILVDDKANMERDKSSTLDAYRPHLPREVLLRLQWFMLHPGARSYVTSTMEEACRSMSSSQLLRHLGIRAGKLNVVSDLMSVLSPPSTGPPKALVSVPVDGGMAIRRAVLERLLGLRSGLSAMPRNEQSPTLLGLRNPTWRRIFYRDNDPTSSSRCLADLCCSLELRHVLNQLIVAIGEFPVELAATDDETREMLMAVADKLLFPNDDASSQLSLTSSFAFGTNVASPWTFDPQPRRDMVAGLVLEAVTTSDVDTTFAAGTLYSLILHLVSIPEADWFALWRKWHLDRRRGQGQSHATASGNEEEDEVNKPSVQELYDWFRCGVAQLEYLGLVRERRSNLVRGKAVYDKPVLVWCGGD